MVEQLFCKQQVVSSNLTVGSIPKRLGAFFQAMSKEKKEFYTQPTDAFEFIGRMSQEKKEKSENEEENTLEESEIQHSCSLRSKQ